MGFNLRVIMHVLGILLTVLALCWILLNTSYYATLLTLTILLSLQVTALIRYVHGTNRELVRFLAAVKYADFSQSFLSPKKSTSFRELGRAFDEVIERLRSTRSDKEAQAAYLLAFVQHLPIAVLALDASGKILISNTALRRLLGRTADLNHLSQIEAFNPTLAGTITRLQAGQEQSLTLTRGHDTLHLKLSCTLLRAGGRQQKLVSIQNIQGELETRELEAWQNLIRVMSHEIMNSITPITSLSETAQHFIREGSRLIRQDGGDLKAGELSTLLEDAGSAVSTIGQRGKGLLRFVESYRTLSRLPQPLPAAFRVLDLFQALEKLMAEQARALQVDFRLSCNPQNLQIVADAAQLEQALINLIKNAFEALAGVSQAQLLVAASMGDLGAVNIEARDNGCGIAPENMDSIFIPFFTTKRGGSGIGMSVVRQIVRLNGGKISVVSELNKGTTIKLVF